jgi:tetratricopeptide (TPR) repeat protein
MLPSLESLIDRAMESRDPALAEEAFRELDLRLSGTEAPRERANLLFRKAVLYGVLKKFGEARKEMHAALQEAPSDWFTRMQFDFIDGDLYDDEGDSKQAYERLTEALAKHATALGDPELHVIYESAQIRRAFNLVRLGQNQQAVPILEEALSFELDARKRALVLARLGRSYAAPSDWEKVRESLEEAFKIGLAGEWAAQSHYSLGIAYAYLHLLRESKQEFRICEEHALEYGAYGLSILKVYDWLSRICKVLGENAEAEHYARLARPT